jgi:rare lipoprotein A
LDNDVSHIAPRIYSIALPDVVPYIPVMVATNSVCKTLRSIIKQRQVPVLLVVSICIFLADCSIIKLPYRVVAGTVMGGYYVVKGAYELTVGTTKLVYRIGEFTFKVVKAPIDWALVNEDIETIDDLPPKEAIRKGRVRNVPYTVKGKKYYPMSVEQAKSYQETGVASWYGYETLRYNEGRMTANGEVFDPDQMTAAHKYLPLPTHIKVTNLENQRSIIVRVNDRGPFPSDRNPSSGDRIIDLSAGAAKKLGFHKKGLAKVRVEAIELKEAIADMPAN